MQKMGFSQAGIAVNKKRIVGISRRLTYRNTACLSKSVARPYDKIIKGIVRVKFKGCYFVLLLQNEVTSPGREASRAAVGFFGGADTEIYRDKITCYLLSGQGETSFAIILQELNGSFIWTTYPERATIQMQYCQLVEPLADVGWVKRLCTVDYISENIFNFANCHATILCESMLYAKNNCPLKTSLLKVAHFTIYPSPLAEWDSKFSPGRNPIPLKSELMLNQCGTVVGNLTLIAQFVKEKYPVGSKKQKIANSFGTNY